MQGIIDAITYLAEFVNSGIYELLTNFIAYLIIKFTEFSIAITIFFTTLGWGVAKAIITQLDLSSHLNNTLGYLDSNALQIIYYMKIPEALNVILTGALTRYALTFIPFV